MDHIEVEINRTIKNIPNFPKDGVEFKDVMPIFFDAAVFKKTIKHMADIISKYSPTHIVGVESRGFLFAAPLAYELSIGFIPVRKKGKLPGRVMSQIYDLEYGTDTLEIQTEAIIPGAKYFIVDDVLATGGTAEAVNILLQNERCQMLGNLFLIELEFLKGRNKLLNKFPDLNIISCLKY